MSGNIYHDLKNLGYLKSPATRWLWGSSPSRRQHLRKLVGIQLTIGVFLATLVAGLSSLDGWDRMKLLVLYALLAAAVIAVLDLLLALALRWKQLQSVASGSQLLNWVAIPLAALVFWLLAVWLRSPIGAHRPLTIGLIWAVLLSLSWVIAQLTHLILVSRLYWFGLEPPRYVRHHLVMMGVLGLIFVAQLWFAETPEIPVTHPNQNRRMVMICFDLPPGWEVPARAHLDSWQHSEFESDLDDISAYWTGIGSGLDAAQHQASLIGYRVPGFDEVLSPLDPTQVPLCTLARMLGLAQTWAESGRQGKYAWEILDQFGLKTFSLGYWHSFPASSRHGGVLTERWTPQQSQNLYIEGLAIPKVDPLPHQFESDLFLQVWQRETAAWSAIETLSSSAYHLLVAYFPLADVLEEVLEGDALQIAQSELQRWRTVHLERLLSGLDEDVAVLVVRSSGRAIDGRIRTRLSFNSPWSRRTVPIRAATEIAPTILEYFGFPADRDMGPSRADEQLPRTDYGPPSRQGFPRQDDQDSYLEQLRSLGYVQ